jgi:hypothetical protein
MKNLHDHRPPRSTATWLAHVAAIALGPTRTGAPAVAIARAKNGRDLTLVITVAV